MKNSFMHKLRENSWIGIVVAVYFGVGGITYYADQYYKTHPAQTTQKLSRIA